MRDDEVLDGDDHPLADVAPSESADADRVSRDMAGIFAEAPKPRPGTDKATTDPIRPIVGEMPPERPRKQAARAPLFLLYGALIGGGLAWMALPRPHATSVPAARTVEPPLPPPAPPSQQFQPVSVAPVPVPIAAMSTPHLPSAHALERTMIVRRAAPALRTAVYHPARAPARRHVTRIARAANDCSDYGRLARARCMRPQVLAADRQLREAYAKAVRAGVDRSMLVAYRNRWNRIRDDAISDPGYVTATFQSMAQRLDAASGRAEF